MSLKTTSLVSVICCVILASCASAPPSWMGNYREEYPSSEYIVQRGSGDTVEFAKTNGLQAIAQYFQTSVDASMQTQLKTMSNGVDTFEQRSTLTDIQVTSQIDLFGVEFTEPYFSKADNQWYILTYIHRETAWRQFKPRIEDDRNAFTALYTQARKQKDTFTEFQSYYLAWNKGQDFLESLELGRLLMDGVDSQYREDRALVATLPATLQEKAQACSMRFSISGDYEEIFTASIKDVFADMGFVVNENSGIYRLKVVVTDNPAKHNTLQAVYPVVDISITDKDGKAVYSLQYKGERFVATTLETAKRRGFRRTATEVKTEIINDFKQF